MCCATTISFAQKSSIKVDLKEGAYPMVIIDGKTYDKEIFDLLDQDKIESITVLKDETAKKKYNAPNGVILVTTKKNTGQDITILGDQAVSTKGHVHIAGHPKLMTVDKCNSDNPLIIVDGKLVSPDELKKLSPGKIKNISIIKDSISLKQYSKTNKLNNLSIINRLNNINRINKIPGIIDIVTNNHRGDFYVSGNDGNYLFETIKPHIYEGNPVIVIDGKISDKATFEKLPHDEIDAVETSTDKNDMKKYNATEKVVFIMTKKTK